MNFHELKLRRISLPAKASEGSYGKFPSRKDRIRVVLFSPTPKEALFVGPADRAMIRGSFRKLHTVGGLEIR